MGACVSTKTATQPGYSLRSSARVRPVEGGSRESVHIVDLDLHEDPAKRSNIPLYYRICQESAQPCLRVTTSCFAVWKRHRRANGYAKVIPAVAAGPCPEPVRVFFFDDNLQNDGTEGGQGICNLRDAITGDFVDFSEGRNGFAKEHLHRHTVVLHSSEYRNVLVKANILDAIGYEDYFMDIIQRYSRPGEKLLVYMDVNSTIMCNDTCAGKDARESLLSVMCELIEVRPLERFELRWESVRPLVVERKMSVKNLVKELFHSEEEGSNHFWKEENCEKLLTILSGYSEMAWLTGAEKPTPVDIRGFCNDFKVYLGSVTRQFQESGIARSWFLCYESLRKLGHSVILNSFGTDTRTVVLATVPDERQVPQVTVNFELWEDRDKNNFCAQYSKPSGQTQAPLPRGSKRTSSFEVAQAPCQWHLERQGTLGSGTSLLKVTTFD